MHLSKTDTLAPSTRKGFWKKGFQTLSHVRLEALYISFFLIILPQLLLEGYFAIKGEQVIEILKQSTHAQKGTRTDIFALGANALEFGSNYVVSYLALWLVVLVAYFALVHISVEFNTGKPPLGALEAIKRGVRSVFPRGLIACVLFLLIFGLAQVILPPLVLFLLPGLMIPVLISYLGFGSFKALKQALFIDYGQGFPGGRWALLFQLISVGAFFYAGVLLSVFVSDWLLHLDEWFGFSRVLFSSAIAGLPVSAMYIASYLLRTLGISFMLVLLASFSASLYFWVKALANALPEKGVRA